MSLALIPGPTPLCVGFCVSKIMYFVYLDEFGHIGPFVSRTDKKYKESPVFGVAGVILQDTAIRKFATTFLQLKTHTFTSDINKSGMIPQKWEKKGSDIFRPKAIARYYNLLQCGFRLISGIKRFNGNICYYGREKIARKFDGNSTGLYTTVFSHAIRHLDEFFSAQGETFVLVVDEHSARKELLTCAEKTMFGEHPARSLISPPFEVESYLNQNIQAADWIAAIIARLAAYEVLPDQYQDYEKFRNQYWDRMHEIAIDNSVIRRRTN